MRRETAIIALLLALVLVPMWTVAVSEGSGGGEQIALQRSANSTLNPTGYFIDTPTELNVYRAGVVSWIGLFGLVGFLLWQVRFARRVGRSGSPIVPGDGVDLNVPAYVESEYRRIVAYWPAEASLRGLWLVGGFSFLTVLFAALFGAEAFGAARSQYLGTYFGLLCLSLAQTITLYYTYFMSSVDVAEERDH